MMADSNICAVLGIHIVLYQTVHLFQYYQIDEYSIVCTVLEEKTMRRSFREEKLKRNLDRNFLVRK